MNLIKLELTNFKTHKHTIIDFCDKINIIIGANDIGKSNIRRAIAWLFYNQGKNVIKYGEKKCSVKAELSNGSIIEKIKSTSINAYIIHKPLDEQGEIRRFNSVGKVIPEEVLDLLQLKPIEIEGEKIILNMGIQQKTFLIDESPTFRSKLFNKLTGSDVTDKIFKSLNKDILRISKESKLVKGYLENDNNKLESTNKELNKLSKKYIKSKKIFDKIKLTNEQYEKLIIIKDRLTELNDNIKETKDKLSKIKTIPEGDIDKLRKLNKKFKIFSELKIKLDNTIKEIKQSKDKLKLIKIIPDENIKKLKDGLKQLTELTILKHTLKGIQDSIVIEKNKLKTLKSTNVDISKLESTLDKYNKLKDIKIKLDKSKNNIVKNKKDIKQLNENIKSNNVKYKELLKKLKKCPTCKSVIDDKVLEGLEL